MTALSALSSFVQNYKPTQSVLSGGAATILVFVVGTVLVSLGVSIPGVGILTMPIVSGAAPIIGQIVTYFVPDSAKDSMQQLANKLQVDVDHLKTFVPQIQAAYPNDPSPAISQGAANGNYNKV